MTINAGYVSELADVIKKKKNEIERLQFELRVLERDMNDCITKQMAEKRVV